MTVSRAFALHSVDGRLLLTDGDPASVSAYDNRAAWVARPDGRLVLCYSMSVMPVTSVRGRTKLATLVTQVKRTLEGISAARISEKQAARRERRRLIGWSSQPAA